MGLILHIALNTVTFNSGHDKSPEFRQPFYQGYKETLYKKPWDFISTTHIPKFTPVTIVVFEIFHFKTENPMGFWWDFHSHQLSHQKSYGRKNPIFSMGL